MKVPKMLLNERGNVSIIVFMLMLGVILGIVIISYYYGSFIVRRQAQNTVDAAAIAAVQELRQHYEAEMKNEVLLQLNQLESSILAEITACLLSGLGDEEEEPDCPTRNELIQERLGAVNELALKLISGTFSIEDEWDLVVLHSYFSSYFTEFRNGDILYQVSVANSTQIRQAANSVILKNDGEPANFIVTFPFEGKPNVHVNGSKTLVAQDVIEGSLDVPARGVAGIVTEFQINVESKVPITIH